MQPFLSRSCRSLRALAAAPALANTDGLSAAAVRIGMVNVQTGPAAGLGKGMRSGAEAVFKQVNAKGGVHGRQIELLVGDDGYEPNRAVDETLKMIEQTKVFSLFGFVGTPTLVAVRTPDAKLIKYPAHDDWTELFDLKNDPYEITNLANDPKQKHLLARMTAEFDQQVKATGYSRPAHADPEGSLNEGATGKKGKGKKAAKE